MKAARVEKLELEREGLERDYRRALIDALHECANGTWGLFGQNERAHAALPAHLRERLTPAAVGTLAGLEEQISSTREKLGYSEPFALSARLSEYRRRHDHDDPGEPRLAREFLEELADAGCSMAFSGNNLRTRAETDRSPGERLALANLSPEGRGVKGAMAGAAKNAARGSTALSKG